MVIIIIGCCFYDKVMDIWILDNCEVFNILCYFMNNNYYIIVFSVIL